MAVAAIDIGGSSIKAALIKNGCIVRKVVLPTMAGRKRVLSNIVSAALMAIGDTKIQYVGVGCPGPIDHGKVLDTKNILLADFDLQTYLQRKLKHKVIVARDVECFTLGEALYGAGCGKKLVAGLALGTGVGGGIVLEGRQFLGRGNAGEFGHMSISEQQKCSCGNIGCIEEFLSTRGIMRLAKGVAKNPKELHELALKGNKKALAAYARAGEYLGIAAMSIIRAIDPDVLVIGGGISQARQYMKPSMERVLRQRLNYKPGKVVFSSMDDAALLGAASLQQTF